MKNKNYGGALRSAIESRGITLTSVAERMRLSQPNLFQMLKKDDVRISIVVRICDIIGCSIEEIIKRANK